MTGWIVAGVLYLSGYAVFGTLAREGDKDAYARDRRFWLLLGFLWPFFPIIALGVEIKRRVFDQ